MKQIPLTQGKFALVDDEDYERLCVYKWCAVRHKNGRWYAVRHKKGGKIIYMHREVMNSQPGQLTDHKDHNGLDNRKENVRFCSRSENMQNSKSRKDGSSEYKGVCWEKREKAWVAYIGKDFKLYSLGQFASEIKAALTYNKKAKELFGKFACLNIIKGITHAN